MFQLKTDFLPSFIENFSISDRSFYIKRDDLIHPHLSGNKFRKLYSLLQTPKEKIDTLISYGGTQSNAMLAIAAMCKMKGWQFEYYTKSLHVKHLENSNYKEAIKLGMKHIELEDDMYKDYIASLTLSLNERSYILHQGGADNSAKEGIDLLAKEIKEECPSSIKSLATPAGTGTTALYLAIALPEFKVYTTPAVGDKEYLLEQMSALEEVPNNLVILESEKKYHFAKPYKDLYEMYLKLKQSDIEFDLIYAPKLWRLLLEQTDEEILYIHSGGTTGNESMLQRYIYKGLVSI